MVVVVGHGMRTGAHLLGLGYFADLRTCGPTNGYFADRKMRTVFADRWVKCGPADP